MKFIKTILKPTIQLLGPSFRKKGLALLPLLLLQSLLDVFSVASFAPLALLLVRPESIQSNVYLKSIYNAMALQNEHYFALAWAGAIVVFFLCKHWISIAITRAKARYAFSVSAALSQQALDYFINMPLNEYTDLRSSQQQVKTTQLPLSFANNIVLSLATLITEGMIVLLLLSSLIAYEWRSIFFIVVLVFPAIVFYRMIKRKLNTIDRSLKENYPGLFNQLFQLFENFIEVNLYQKQAYFVEKIRRLTIELNESQVMQTILQANSFRLFETTAAVGLCLLIIYSLVAGISPDATVVLLGLYTAAGFRVVPSFNRIFVAFLQIKTNEHVLSGLAKISTPPATHGPALTVNFKATLKLENISFGHPAKPMILQHLNLTIEKGQRIALTGASGSGKTTLLLLIMRFLKETTGELRVDDTPLTERHSGSWRRHLAYVPQQPVILDGSLTENIAYGGDPANADVNKIETLLQGLGLGAWLRLLPDGLNTRFGEHGIKLSGGQRQRLAIARALYTEAPVLLFDEATSQVDTITENEIHETLKTIGQQNKTLIMVTHRESSLRYFDKVFHLHEGRIRKQEENLVQ